jgi:hypothetical protein
MIKKFNEMTENRETIQIDKEKLKVIIFDDTYEMKKMGLLVNGIKKYSVVEDEITSADEEDGGGEHEVIIKRTSDNKYFKVTYSNWDLNYNFARDFPEHLTEVFPEKVTITVYK